MSAILYYAHDPMCSWCWAFRPAWLALLEQLPEEVRVQRLLGGLAPDTDTPMPEEMRHFLQETWRRIERRVPGARFNFAFWEHCQPRRSTYPACRAVIASRRQDPAYEESMILAIQQAYYLQASNPSNKATLVELALEIGLDTTRFLNDLDSAGIQSELEGEITTTRSMGLSSFPALALEIAGTRWPVPVDYSDPRTMSEQIQLLLE